MGNTSTSQELSTLWDIVAGLISCENQEIQISTWNDQGNLTSYSSHQFAQKILELSLGLKSIINPQERIGLIGKSCPEWMLSDLAILGAGGVTVPLFPGTSPDILAYQLQKAEVQKIIVLQDHNVVCWDHLKLEVVICPNPIPAGQHPILEFASICHSINDDRFSWEEAWSRLNQSLSPEQLATIIFTSGSTGKPKGVPLTHLNMITQIRGSNDRFPLNTQEDVALSFLPLAHVFERMVSYYYLYRRIPIYFCDQIQNLGQRMKEVQPSIMTSVPRLLEKVQSSMSAKTLQKPSPQKEIGRWALSLALTQSPEKNFPILSWIAADHLVYSKFREALGGKLKMLIVGGAPLSPRLARFFNNIGIPTYQGYGMTETSPVIASNCPGYNKMGSVGVAFPEVQIKIDPLTREICTKGPSIMSGYIDEEETIIDHEGWLHTGDLGELDQMGFLTITGRKKEMMKTSNGKYVCPIPIEAALSSHLWIDQAMIIAEGKPYVTALLVADDSTIPETLKVLIRQSEHIEDLHPSPEIIEHLRKLNASLNPWEKVQKYCWIPQCLSVENGELTPTLKIRRHIIENKYSYLIEHMYNT